MYKLHGDKEARGKIFLFTEIVYFLRFAFTDYFAIFPSNFGDITIHICTVCTCSYVSIATLLSFPYLDNEMLSYMHVYARISVHISAYHLDTDICEYSR